MSRAHSFVLVGSALTLALAGGACVKTTASDMGAGGSNGGGAGAGGTIARSGGPGSGGGAGTIGSIGSGAGGGAGGGSIGNDTGGAGSSASDGGDDAAASAATDAGQLAATCSICDKAEVCCVAFVQKLYGGADAATECSNAYSSAMCNGLPTVKPDGGFLDGGYTMSAYISDCVTFLASGAALAIAACE